MRETMSYHGRRTARGSEGRTISGHATRAATSPCGKAEILALRAARDAAIRVAAWGGARRIESGTRDEH